jgi:hypothetical protein
MTVNNLSYKLKLDNFISGFLSGKIKLDYFDDDFFAINQMAISNLDQIKLEKEFKEISKKIDLLLELKEYEELTVLLIEVLTKFGVHLYHLNPLIIVCYMQGLVEQSLLLFSLALKHGIELKNNNTKKIYEKFLLSLVEPIDNNDEGKLISLINGFDKYKSYNYPSGVNFSTFKKSLNSYYLKYKFPNFIAEF